MNAVGTSGHTRDEMRPWSIVEPVLKKELALKWLILLLMAEILHRLECNI